MSKLRTRRARALAWTLAAGAVVGLAAAVAAEEEAAAATAASGSFASRGISFEIVDAYAFRAPSTFGDEPAIVVAVSNAGFNDDFVDRYRDRRYLLDTYFSDDETAIVWLEFSPAGEYQGLSFYLASGNGCGYCSGGATSTVKLVDGRLVGSLRHDDTDSERQLTVELDVPLAPDDFGTALGAGGGEPGRAYLAFHEALAGGDAATLKPLLAAGMLENLTRAEAQDDVAGYLAYLRREHPERLTVTEGFVEGERALLITTGEGALGKVAGEALLERVDGAWRVGDEMYQLVAE